MRLHELLNSSTKAVSPVQHSPLNHRLLATETILNKTEEWRYKFGKGTNPKSMGGESTGNPYSSLISATAVTAKVSPVMFNSKKLPKKHFSLGGYPNESVDDKVDSKRETISPIPLHQDSQSPPPENPFKDVVKSDSHEI